jgi:putative transcriptional regulator
MTSDKLFDGNHINPALLQGTSPFRKTLLVAMPGMSDARFNRAVIYMCGHSADGAMGIVLNHLMPEASFAELLKQLSLQPSALQNDPVIHFGGPVDISRGFILHSTDVTYKETGLLTETLGLTTTVDIVKAISLGRGPKKTLFALGYAGWSPGQLEIEMQENAWLTVPAADNILFDTPIEDMWVRAMSVMGITPITLSADAGHA